jgi:gluconate kinase
MADDGNENLTPWKNGYYHTREMPSMLYLVDGEKFVMHSASGKPSNVYDLPAMQGTWKYGDFGEASEEVAKESGKSRYNLEMTAWGGLFKPKMVVSDDGKQVTFFGMTNCVDVFEWMSEEEFAEYVSTGDDVDAYPHDYKIQPENQGKLVWLSGAPGLGKSTSGLLLGKNAGYVYYEADAFMSHVNPYVPLDAAEPSLATILQNFMKGVPQERIDVVANSLTGLLDLCQGREYDFETTAKFYTFLCKDIAREQKRIGGDFAIAQAVPSRKFRDHIRSQMGENLVFAVLHMSKEDQLVRIKARHGEANEAIDMLTKCYDVFEPAAEDEPNTIHVIVTKEMTREDVADKIIRLLHEHSK